jgi:hypothetical protein
MGEVVSTYCRIRSFTSPTSSNFTAFTDAVSVQECTFIKLTLSQRGVPDSAGFVGGTESWPCASFVATRTAKTVAKLRTFPVVLGVISSRRGRQVPKSEQFCAVLRIEMGESIHGSRVKGVSAKPGGLLER